ncbi:MAG: translocation and assembly module subunit TamB [Sodalis sp. Ffu]|nr:MAG: translocation and assembly module subunit TamB [Sodalis sp. Ffu]
MSLLKKCFLVFLLLFSTLVFLFCTATGLHLVLNGVTHLVPGLEIALISGGWRDLTLKQLSYQMPGITIDAGEFHLSLDWGCLWHRQFCVNDLSLRDVSVKVKTSKLGSLASVVQRKSKAYSFISTFYPLILRRLVINNIQVKVNNTAVMLNQFSSGLTFRDNSLVVTPTRIAGLLVVLPTATQFVADHRGNAGSQAIKFGTGSSRSSQNSTQAEAEWAGVRAQPSLAQTLEAFFAKPLLPLVPTFTMPFSLTLERIDGENLCVTGESNLPITRLRMQASAHYQHAELTLLDINSPHGLFNASGSAQLNGKWPVNLMINTILHIDPLKEEKIKMILSGGLRDELCINLNLSGPISAQLVLKTRLSQVGLPLMLVLDSEDIQWPLAGKAQYRVQGMTLRLDGRARDYRMTMKAVLSGESSPLVNIAMEAKGNTDGFILSRLRLSVLEGYTDLTAVVDWQRAISWRSELTLSGLNTSGQWPAWPARLVGKMTILGSLYSGNWQLQVPSLDLRGNIEQSVFTIRGSLSGNSAGRWQVPELLLALGDNTLEVKGDIKDKFALDATLHAPVLTGAVPGLGGSAQGSIKLRGDLKAPQLLVDFNASALRWDNLMLRRVALKGEVHQCSDIIRGDVQLHMDQLQQGMLSVRQLILSVTGDEKQHQLKLVMQGKPVAGQLQLNGSFDRAHQSWYGALSQTSLATLLGEWHLTRNMVVDYQNLQRRIIIGPHCWKNSNAQICMPHNIEAGACGQVSAVMNHFDLAILKPLLPADTQVSGVFTGRADLRWAAGGGLPNGKVSLVGNRVKINQTLQSKTLSLVFDTITLNIGLYKRLAILDWLIKIADNGQFNGQVQMLDPENRRNLLGNVNINGMSLMLLKPLLSRGECVSGLLHANLQLGGNVQRPRLYGQLGLERLVIQGGGMPFAMTDDSRLSLNFTGTSSALQAVIGTSNGQIHLSGNADWSCMEAWCVHIGARGNKVRITVPSLVRLDISPDIIFEATPALFAFNGKVDIPWGSIEVKDLPSSVVGISPDEVLFDDKLLPDIVESSAIPISTNLLVHVGDDVHISAFGLQAKLKGDLKIVQDKQGLGLNGQIDIPSGRFHAYGQDLVVSKGQLLFSGPVDRPYLNVEAIRNPAATEDDVTAGVRVTGMADKPKLEVFSDPIKSQQEALSYLLRGQGLEGSGADNNMMTSMLIGMGVAQSGQLVGKIGEAFGVSNLALDTQGVGDSSQVVVSGYIARGLQVKYGVGIFDSLATLTLRYRLMPKLYLEAVSGLDQALALFYRFEF